MKNDQTYTGFEIAIVGMACRFPGAGDWRTYWENLKNGVESVQFLSNEELNNLGVDAKTINDTNFVNARIILENKDRFDAAFFNYTQRVAGLMNPQHRIFHECVWEALEDAGYVPEQVRGISLYAGAGDDLNWKVHSLLKNRDHEVDDYTLRYISDNNFLPSLISYSLDLQGPSFSVNSACSTSLVAIHLACKSLLLGEVKMALAGGISINTAAQKGYLYQEGMINSADGHCRAFDKNATGTLKGEGAGIVVLKRLTDAMQDGDHIYAIIKGSAINNDGSRKVGFTAPSVEAQAECILKAQRFAKVEPATIGYVEAHGSGTRLGDPIEMAALNTVFKNKASHCAIGSVKSNMGHLNTAAGIAGLIKAVLSLKYKAIPASLHYKEPNPEIDFTDGPFYVNTSLKGWERNGNYPLRAAVNSLGIGGTNAHVILEEAPAQQAEPYTAHDYKLLTLSAKTESALIRYIDRFKSFLLKTPVIDAADMAYTLQTGRKHFAYRKTIAFRSREELIPLLNAAGIFQSKDRSNSIVCIFSAEGAQYANMGRGLYESNAFFRQEMDTGLSVLEERTEKKPLPLQHLVFPFQYALARLIMRWGINPRFMIGDAIGECIIACIKGELSYRDSLKLAFEHQPENSSPQKQLANKIKDLQTQHDDLIYINIGHSLQQTDTNDLVWINLIKPREHTGDDVNYLLEAIGQLWSLGVSIDWRSWYKDEKRKRISLPTYSFEPTRYPTEVDPFENGLGYEINSFNSISAYEVDSAATGTDSETKLKEIFETLLEIEDIGGEDDFLKLGGNSLVAMLIVKRIEKVFSINLALDVFFSNPTIKQLAFAIDEIKLLPYAIAPRPKILKALPGANYPLTSSQRRLWILNQFEHTNLAYNLGGVDVFEGELDVTALENCLKLLIERHETLRTVFKEDDQGEVRQFVIPANDTGFTLDIRDIRNDKEQKIVIRNLVQKLILQPFDLAAGPLLRAGLYQMEDNKWVFTHAIHHIISDAWTLDVLIKELLRLYDAQVKGDPYPLQPLPIQYKDYAVWQQEQLQGAFFQAHKDWWLKQFEGELPVLQMPGDRTRPAVKSYNGGVTGKRMNQQLIEDLKSLVHSQGGTLFMGLLATLNTLLYRYTNQEDLIIGSPIAAREHIELEDQLGFYVNTLALRTRFKGEDSFIELLEKVKTITVGAYEHQMYPFDELVNELKLHRDMSRSALFDVMIILHPYNIKMDVQQLGAVKVTAYEEAVEVTSKFDLLFRFIEWGEEVQLNLEYNTDIYDRITAEQLIDHFERLLTAAIAQPELPVLQLDLLSTAEKDQLQLHFNNTNTDYPRDKTIVNLFEEQSTKTPHSIALVFEEKQFTFTMLNDISNQLANYLRVHYSVQPDDLIGIKLARNEWMILSILGVLKSGGAYMPIDPEYPQERIDYIIADSRCKVVIDEPELLKFKNEATKYDGGNLAAINNSTHLAYVMYTSGSTGKPKGVMIEHRNVVSFLENFDAHFFEDNTLIMGAATSYTFDISVLELVGSLVKGIKLFLIASADPLQILKHISDGEINALQITPSRLTQLLEAASGNINALGQLKVLLVGGEALAQSNYERLKELTGTKVKHVYGPTETTIWSSCLDVQTSASLSIGKPLLNETIYITDQLLNITPRGVVGEICIGGEGVGRGYWRLPELTAEKFVNNPFKQGERLYRTGDLGRWLPDGNIEFIGRKDDQVKIRGYRVELGEIETALLHHPAITAAVVIAKHLKDTSRELVAYIVSGEKLPIAELRTHLSRSLPVYMLPAHFVQLDQLPLSSRGKVDKTQLPEPTGMAITTRAAYVLPRNAIEEKLTLIWQEVLGLDRVGIKDNFFDLGGHSLKATRLASRIHKVFEIKIAFIDLFKHVVLEDQARLIEQAQKTSFSTIPATASQASYPLSSSQRRLWVVSQLEDANIAYNINSVYVLEWALNTAALSGAFNRLIMRHEILRTAFKENEAGEIRQCILSAQDIRFNIEYHDLRKEAAQEEKARQIVQNGSTQPFNLAIGPLVRACLLHINDNKWIFTCTMHHIISDGWSRDVLIKELLQFYNAHGKGITNPLVPLRIHYKDYAVWQQEQLQSEALQNHKNYWLQQFTGELPVQELPEDKVRPLVKTYNGGVVKSRISPAVNSALNSLVRKQECTLFMGLLAAVNTLLFKYTNQEDIIIGTPIAGRMHSDLEDQIGFYVNTLAIRTKFTDTDDYRAVLKNIRQLTLNAYEHQVYPFDELVTELNLQRDMSRSALFDVMVTLQNTPINHQHELLNDIKISAYELAENTVSKFDLEFSFVEVGEELLINLVYNSDIYNKSTAEQFINHLTQLIEAIIAFPDKPINELDFLSEEEKYRQIIEFNNTDRPV